MSLLFRFATDSSVKMLIRKVRTHSFSAVIHTLTTEEERNTELVICQQPVSFWEMFVRVVLVAYLQMCPL